MHFLLIGATGRTGRLILDESLVRDHTVTALVRDPSKIKPQGSVRLVKGSPMSSRDISAAFDSPADTDSTPVDAVLVSLNVKRESGSPWAKPISPANLMEKSITNVASAMKEHGVRKLVVMSAFGVGDSFSQMPFYLRLLVSHSNMGPQFEDHDAAHRLVKEDGQIDWVFLRPIRLTEGPRAKVKESGDLGKGISGTASISIASVAAEVVSAAEGPRVRRTTVIAN